MNKLINKLKRLLKRHGNRTANEFALAPLSLAPVAVKVKS